MRTSRRGPRGSGSPAAGRPGAPSRSRGGRLACIIALILLFTPSSLFPGAAPDSCETVAGNLNRTLPGGIDEEELVRALRSLNSSGDRKLPEKFVTKGRARRMGWRPGRDLWGVAGLQGKSIGGDRFGNREGRLPRVTQGWREADLDYKGGRRGAKRLVYSAGGRRMITVDHYSTFREVPACR